MLQWHFTPKVSATQRNVKREGRGNEQRTAVFTSRGSTHSVCFWVEPPFLLAPARAARSTAVAPRSPPPAQLSLLVPPSRSVRPPCLPPQSSAPFPPPRPLRWRVPPRAPTST